MFLLVTMLTSTTPRRSLLTEQLHPYVPTPRGITFRSVKFSSYIFLQVPKRSSLL